MSRAYWVKLSSSVSETVEASDKAIHRIELDAVVPEGEMVDLLEGALTDSGWEKQEDGTYKKESTGGITLVWDLPAMTVEARVDAERELVQEIEVSGRGYEESTARREAERLLSEREKAAHDAMGVERARLQGKLSEKLGANEADRVKEVNEVLRKTYADAIRRKADRLGNVTSVQESTGDDGEYRLTITIAE
jgi:hypothetical protein